MGTEPRKVNVSRIRLKARSDPGQVSRNFLIVFSCSIIIIELKKLD